MLADKITETNILAIGVRYISEYATDAGEADKKKTIYLKLNNPKENLTAQQIKNVTEPLLQTQPEQAGAFWTNPITGENFDSNASVFTAYTEYQKIIDYDLEIPE